MNENINLIQDVTEVYNNLMTALNEYPKRGKEYAEAHRRYRTVLRQEILIERNKGTPVTIINDICRGQENVAILCEKRDIAEALYKSAQEAINVYKLRLRIVNDEVNREYHS